jgi:hypothetical protein
MRAKLTAVSALTLLLATSPMAMAAATDEGATHLEEVFQKYLGDTEDVVSVEADGDNYNLTLDLAKLADSSKMEGGKFEMSSIELTLHDNGGGKWQVSKEGPFTFLVDVPGTLHLEGGSDDYTMTGVFDEAISGFTSSTAEAKKFNFKEEFTDPKKGTKANVELEILNAKSTSTSAANASGGIDFDAKIDMGAVTEKMDVGADPTANTPAMNLLLSAQSGTTNFKATGFRNQSILDLIAFFVAHKDKDSIIKDQSDLKKIMSAALPLWNTMGTTSEVKNVKVTSPFGEFGMDAMTGAVDTNGAVKDGKFNEKFSLTGLSLPASLVPPWAATMVPKTVNFDVTASGFDLADPASMILASLDLSTPDGLPKDFEKTLLPALLPKGAATISFNQTGIANDTYNLKADATMDVGPAAQPTGKAKISLKGFDEITKAIQAAPPEAGLQSSNAMIVVAKGLAKTESDGSLTWNVEATPDGKILLNGTDVNSLKQ